MLSFRTKRENSRLKTHHPSSQEPARVNRRRAHLFPLDTFPVPSSPQLRQGRGMIRLGEDGADDRRDGLAILGFAIASTPPCVLLSPERTHGKMRAGDEPRRVAS